MIKYGENTAYSEPNMCFNVYCIYQKGVHCQLPSIFLNEQGVCKNCKMLSPDQEETVLQYRKDHSNKR